MAEPADIISVVDAESFQSKQRFDVFGEIGGISFTPDGSEFFVANTDRRFGGIMEYERIGHGEKYGMRYLRQREIEDAGDEYYDEKAFEWLRTRISTTTIGSRPQERSAVGGALALTR
jgi:DNA-binding beta-propeller fold protein YncE